MQQGLKSGNVSETCRRFGIAPTLYYRWKDEAEQGSQAALGGRRAAAAKNKLYTFFNKAWLNFTGRSDGLAFMMAGKRSQLGVVPRFRAFLPVAAC